MRYLIACAALACAPALAGPVAMFKADNVTVYAYTEPCEVPQLAAILAQFGPSRKAAVLFEGRELVACYAVQGDQVLIVDSDLDGGRIPVSAFTEAKGV